MKNQTRIKASLRLMSPIAVLAVVGCMLAGCVVTSVYPFYTEKDLVFEPALLGEWIPGDGDEPPKPGECTRVERLGEQGYRAIVFTEHETNSVICHLFRLKNQLFLDTCPTNHSLELIPVHQVSKVTQVSPYFENANLNYKWLEQLLKHNPKAIRHTIVHDKFEGKDGGRIVLTADTAELQKFVLKHLNNPNAWDKSSKVKRPQSRH